MMVTVRLPASTFFNNFFFVWTGHRILKHRLLFWVIHIRHVLGLLWYISLRGCFQQLMACGFQRPQLVLHHIPHNGKIDAKVFMNKDIAKRFYFSPFNLGSLFYGFLRKFTCRLTDDLEIPNDSVLSFPVSGELLLIHAASIQADLGNGIKDVVKIEPEITHKPPHD